MDKEQLLERKRLLEQDEQNYLAMANQVRGAIEDCNFWISKIEGAVLSAPNPENPQEAD